MFLIAAVLSIIRTFKLKYVWQFNPWSIQLLLIIFQEQQAMSAEERDLLTKMVVCFNDYLVPYIQRCLQSVYSPAEISFFLSVPVFKLQEKVCKYIVFK